MAEDHSLYIQRLARFARDKYSPVIAQEYANFPQWVSGDLSAFWRAADKYERANGSAYREFEVALPRELTREAQIMLVRAFAQTEFAGTRPYLWLIYAPTGEDGKERPQARMMFSDRQLDGIERGPEQFFKRYNPKAPEKGGARKFSYGTPTEARQAYVDIRERWARVQNLALEHAGVEARVDHRSLAEQGIQDREPGVHRGFVVNAIERRGQVSYVGKDKRRQWRSRAEARGAVVDELRQTNTQIAQVIAEVERERQELFEELRTL